MSPITVTASVFMSLLLVLKLYYKSQADNHTSTYTTCEG